MSVQDTETDTDTSTVLDPTLEETERIEETEWTARHRWRRWGPWVVTTINLAVFFLIWQLVAMAEIINPLFLPPPTEVFKALWEGFTTTAPVGAVISGSIRDHVFYSLTNLTIGVLLACAIGIPLGLLMGANKYVDAILSPYVWAISSMPRIALVPLFILFLGFTRTMQVTIIVLSAVFPIMINAWAGVKTTDKSLLSAAKVFGASQRQLYTKVVLPFTLPFIIAGIQQGIGRGLVGVIIAEIFGGSRGLGYLIQRASDTFDSALLYAVLFLLVVISLSLIQLTRWWEAKAAPWRHIDRL